MVEPTRVYYRILLSDMATCSRGYTQILQRFTRWHLTNHNPLNELVVNDVIYRPWVLTLTIKMPKSNTFVPWTATADRLTRIIHDPFTRILWGTFRENGGDLQILNIIRPVELSIRIIKLPYILLRQYPLCNACIMYL